MRLLHQAYYFVFCDSCFDSSVAATISLFGVLFRVILCATKSFITFRVKCIVVTRVCVCVCLSVRGRMPTLLHGPGCNLGEW